MARAAASTGSTLDPGLVRLIEALAREAARRDHAAATGQAAPLKALTHARGDLRSILNRPAE
ncbi:hypothetical protein ASE61_14900 [Bosea sp. Root670]|uniref:hypothetical protein n=1 Tax=Bosea sp. Root670 TaxID=1736583 RepID=UPI000714BAFE|nr:hypothetical protein [Bosea sp. Root670]KRE02566.1 hypothetical protein ASE61_14900 [Bosea sp. Root670]